MLHSCPRTSPTCLPRVCFIAVRRSHSTCYCYYYVATCTEGETGRWHIVVNLSTHPHVHSFIYYQQCEHNILTLVILMHQWSTHQRHETISFMGQFVKHQSYTRPNLDLSAWWRHQSRPPFSCKYVVLNCVYVGCLSQICSYGSVPTITYDLWPEHL